MWLKHTIVTLTYTDWVSARMRLHYRVQNLHYRVGSLSAIL